MPLSATPASRWAVAILSTSLKPVDPVQWPVASPLQPSPTATMPHRPSAILIAHTSDPFNPMQAATLSHGTIQAITPASRTSSAWDFARRHFYIFSSTDIHSLSISRTSATSSLSSLMPVGIHSPDKVTVTSGGVIAIGTDGVIRCVRGSTISLFASPATPPASIAWSAATSELWTLDDTLLPVTVYPDARQQYYRRSDITPEKMFCVGPHILIAAQGTLYQIARNNPKPFTPVDVTLHVAIKPHTPLRHVTTEIISSMATLTIDIRGDNGDTHASQRIIAFTTGGQLKAPIRAAIPTTPFWRHITLHIHGTVTPDTLLGPATLR